MRGVKAAALRRTDNFGRVITAEQLRDVLLPQVLERYRALVAVAGGCGLRWDEVIGL